MIFISLALGLFAGICTFFIMLFLEEYTLAFPMAILACCLVALLILTVLLFTNIGIKHKRKILTKKYENEALLSSLGLYKSNNISEAISFFACVDCFFICFHDKKQNDSRISFDDIEKIYFYEDSNQMTIISKNSDDIDLFLYDFIDLNKAVPQDKIQSL